MIHIPTEEERIQVYKKISKAKDQQANQVDIQFQNQQKSQEHLQAKQKPLSRAQIEEMINRLSRQTKKHYQIQQQIEELKQANIKLKQKRNQSQKVQERLLKHGKIYEKRKEELTKAHENQIKQKYYRITPQITERAKQMIQPPIMRRLDEIISDREIIKQNLSKKYQPSFHPIINPYSQFINDIQNFGDCHNRMDLKEKQAENRKQKLRKKILSQRQIDCTYNPVINQKSRILAQKKERIVNNKKSQPKLAFSQIESQKYSFIPSINRNTQNLLKDKDNNQNCFDRLYRKSKEISMKKQIQKQKREKSFNFQPKLSRKSQQIISQINSKHKISSSEDQQKFEEIFVQNKSYFKEKKARSVLSLSSAQIKGKEETNYTNLTFIN